MGEPAAAPDLSVTYPNQLYHNNTATGNSRQHIGPVINNVYNLIRRVTSSLNDKDRDALLRWLSPLDSSVAHERISQPIHGDAGKWLLTSSEFDDWRSRKHQELWCLGAPGAGKTVLASIIVNHLTRVRNQLKGKDDNTGIAYLYLSYKEKQSLEVLIGSVVRQLIQDQDQIPAPAFMLWKEHLRQGSEAPSIQQLTKLFGELVAERPAFIVIDALDECEHHMRHDLIKRLRVEGDRYCLLVTSRYLDEFEEIAKPFVRINITASRADFDTFIDNEIESSRNLTRFSLLKKDLKDDIKHGVWNKSRGMFLLATLHMKTLTAQMTLSAVLEKLKCLPSKIDETYDNTLARIEAQDTPKRDAALQVLSWVTYAKRHLQVEELVHALAIVPGTKDLNFDSLLIEDDIRDLCCGLVTIENRVVQLVHYTAQTYFTNIRSARFRDFDTTITLMSATYLAFERLEQLDNGETDMFDEDFYFEVLRTQSDDAQAEPANPAVISQASQYSSPAAPKPLSLSAKFERYPFAKYAASYLRHHFRQIKDPDAHPEIIQAIRVLLDNNGKRNFFLRLLIREDIYGKSIPQMSYLPNISDADSVGDSVEEETTEADFYSLLHGLLESSTDSEADGEEGSEEGQDGGEHQEDQDNQGNQENIEESPDARLSTEHDTLEMSAASEDHELDDVFEIQEASHSRVSSPPSVGPDPLQHMNRTETRPLHLAVFLGCRSLVEKFIAEEQDIEILDVYGQSPLVLSVEYDYFDILDILIHHGARVNFETAAGHAVLLHAARMDKTTTVQSLISASLKSKEDEQGKAVESLLQFNVYGYAIMLLQVLWGFILRLGLIDLLFRGKAGQLISSGNTELRQQKVLQPSVVEQTRRQDLQLLLSAYSGDTNTIQTLIDSGEIDLKSKDSYFNGTALFLSIEHNETAVLELLLNYGVNINLQDQRGDTPLHRATARNSLPVVRILLDHKASVDTKSRWGETAWSANIGAANQNVLDELLRAGADPNTRAELGISRLYQTASGGLIKEVEYLLKSGVNPSITTIYGWAPLHWAAHNGYLECVQALLAYNADLNPLSDTSFTPLDMARQGGQEVIARILLEAGAKTGDEVYKSVTKPATYYEKYDSYENDGSESSSDDTEDDDDLESEIDDVEKFADWLIAKDDVPAEQKKGAFAKLIQEFDISTDHSAQPIATEKSREKWTKLKEKILASLAD